MMSAKVATTGLRKITVFWRKGHDIIIHVDDLTNRVLSHDSNWFVDLFMWPKVDKSSITMVEVMISFL